MSRESELRSASGEELVRLIHLALPAELSPLLENPALSEDTLCLVLQRKDLPREFLEEILIRRHFLKSYRVKKALAFHPHTPRTEGFRLLKVLYLMDLVQFSLSPGVLPDLKIKAEEQVVAKLPQLPLGQKITLARRASARIAGALLAEGNPPVVKAALGNPNLSEAQVLRVLSRGKVPPVVVQSIAHHEKWSHIYNVRIALVRQPATTLSTILSYLPELTVSDLNQLVAPGILPENLRHYLQAEIERRRQRPKTKDAGPSPETGQAPADPNGAASYDANGGSDPEELD